MKKGDGKQNACYLSLRQKFILLFRFDTRQKEKAQQDALLEKISRQIYAEEVR